MNTIKIVLTALLLIVFTIALMLTLIEYKEGRRGKAVALAAIAGCCFGMAVAVFLLYDGE